MRSHPVLDAFLEKAVADLDDKFTAITRGLMDEGTVFVRYGDMQVEIVDPYVRLPSREAPGGSRGPASVRVQGRQQSEGAALSPPTTRDP